MGENPVLFTEFCNIRETLFNQGSILYGRRRHTDGVGCAQALLELVSTLCTKEGTMQLS